MKISLAAREDHDKIIALFKQNNFALLEPEWFAWKHFKNPYGESIILKAENDKGHIVATASLIPQLFHYRGESYVALQAVDGIIRPDMRGTGLFSHIMDALLSYRPANVERNYFYIGFPSLGKSKSAFVRAGWQCLAKLHTLDYILRPSKLRAFACGSIVAGLMTIPLMAARSLMFRVKDAASYTVKHCTALPASCEEPPFADRVVGGRSASFVHWRVLDNPKDQMEYFTVNAVGEEPLGYIIGRPHGNNYEIMEWRFSRNQPECLSIFLHFIYTTKKSDSVTFMGYQNLKNCESMPHMGIKRQNPGGVVFVHGLESAGLPSDPDMWDLTLIDSDW